MDAVDERRISKRITFNKAVRYELKDPSHFRGCVAYDLSETGVRLRLNDFLAIDTQVVMNIELTTGQIVECMGKIAWISQIPFMDQYQAGVEFLEPELLVEPKKKIRYYIRNSN